jgi:hypothetical protein
MGDVSISGGRLSSYICGICSIHPPYWSPYPCTQMSMQLIYELKTHKQFIPDAPHKITTSNGMVCYYMIRVTQGVMHNCMSLWITQGGQDVGIVFHPRTNYYQQQNINYSPNVINHERGTWELIFRWHHLSLTPFIQSLSFLPSTICGYLLAQPE